MSRSIYEDLWDVIKDWVADNVSISDIFKDEDIAEAASGFDPEDVFKRSELIDVVAASSLPEDVFPEAELKDWAERNGFVKSEDNDM